MPKLPHRVSSHEIDTEACGIVSCKLGRNWEIRDITGRDFGIDKMAERFEDGYATSEIIMIMGVTKVSQFEGKTILSGIGKGLKTQCFQAFQVVRMFLQDLHKNRIKSRVLDSQSLALSYTNAYVLYQYRAKQLTEIL